MSFIQIHEIISDSTGTLLHYKSHVGLAEKYEFVSWTTYIINFFQKHSLDQLLQERKKEKSNQRETPIRFPNNRTSIEFEGLGKYMEIPCALMYSQLF